MKLVVPVVRPINFPIGRTVVAALVVVVVCLVVVAIWPFWPFAFCCVRCDCRYSTQHATTINHIEWSQWRAVAGEE